MTGPLKDGDIIGNRYEIIRYVGEGGMQYVYQARDRVTERLVALKTPKNSSATKRFRRSAIVAAKVNHPNVAKTLDYLKTDSQRFLVEEFIEGSDLKGALLQETAFFRSLSGSKSTPSSCKRCSRSPSRWGDTPRPKADKYHGDGWLFFA